MQTSAHSAYTDEADELEALRIAGASAAGGIPAFARIEIAKPSGPRLTHIVGEQGSGKTTLAMQIMASLNARHIATAWVDGEAFDHIFGYDLEALVHAYASQECVLIEQDPSQPLRARPGDKVIRLETVQALPEEPEDTWRAVLAEYTSHPQHYRPSSGAAVVSVVPDFFPTEELLKQALGFPDTYQAVPAVAARLAVCMESLGFVQHRESVAKHSRGYLRLACKAASSSAL